MFNRNQKDFSKVTVKINCGKYNVFSKYDIYICIFIVDIAIYFALSKPFTTLSLMGYNSCITSSVFELCSVAVCSSC